jgi:spermidine/putrescine transport system permease protein
VLIAYSFNAEAYGYTWHGFTLEWYRELFRSDAIWDPLKTSLIVALSTVFLSVSMASFFVFFCAQRSMTRLLYLFYASLAVPEVVLAVGLLSMFFSISVPLGTITLIAAHTVIGLGYVVPIIASRYVEIDKRLMEASLDLGATQIQTFFKIVLPLMFPAIMAGSMLVFIISFDDFILSFFCSGASTQTLPVYIFSRLREGASPELTALSVILLAVSSLLILIFSSLQVRKGKGVS